MSDFPSDIVHQNAHDIPIFLGEVRNIGHRNSLNFYMDFLQNRASWPMGFTVMDVEVLGPRLDVFSDGFSVQALEAYDELQPLVLELHRRALYHLWFSDNADPEIPIV